VGALVDPDLERILRLQPDLVVIYASQIDLRQQLARASIPVFEYRHGGLEDVSRTIRALGATVGHSADAERVASHLERRFAAVRARVTGRRRPRTLLVFGRDPGTLRSIYASGGSGFLHDMLRMAGGENVFADVARENVQASSEQILARAPEVILEIRAEGLAGPAGAGLDPAWQAIGGVPAVRDNRVIVLTGSEFVVAGPRVADALERMAAALHR
jgi:iron complex transport system substrate-binding protein